MACDDTLLASHTGYLRILETAHDMADGFRVDHRVGIGHHGDGCGDQAEPVVEGCRLAATFGRKHHLDVRILSQTQVGIVGRTVGHPHQMELFARIVQQAGVLDFLVDHVLLVEGADQEGDVG